jgi:hypothetical protein
VPTLLSRSITIRMEKTAAETVDMWIAPFVVEDAAALRKRCATSAAEHTDALEGRRPNLLGMINRAAEVWWVLLAERCSTAPQRRSRPASTPSITRRQTRPTAFRPLPGQSDKRRKPAVLPGFRMSSGETS